MVFTENVLEFDPVVFLRCHSKNKDSADFHTQVWHCAFEPNINDPSTSTSVISTCGGNSICFIDSKTGNVINKYYAELLTEQFFTLAWTTVPVENKMVNILVAGGARCTLHFINRIANECVLVQKIKVKGCGAIHTVIFHPIHKDILFCGISDGTVCVFKLEHNFQEGWNSVKICEGSAQSEVFDITFCKMSKLLLLSCNDGLVGFPFTIMEKRNKSMGNLIKFKLPENPVEHFRNSSELVDSIESLENGIIACKPALHGLIYLFDLKKIDFNNMKQKGSVSIVLHPIALLSWSSTDNYFMYMTYCTEKKLLGCGDDKGSLWLYDLNKLLENWEMKRKDENKENLQLPTAILPWPKLNDEYGDKKRKLQLQVYDIVVDKVAIHSSGHYLVAVTNNNLVCIWKKVR